MLTGEIRSQVDRVWDAFWSGGISNPLEVMEQLTYLLFIKGLDERQTLAENKANRTGRADRGSDLPRRRVDDARSAAYDDLRWSRFKNLAPGRDVRRRGPVRVPVPAPTRLGDSTYANHMKRCPASPSPTPALLAKAVDGLDAIPMEDRDTKGDVYEYMLSKIATAGTERAVPHPPPHHPADGRDDRPDADRHHLRPGRAAPAASSSPPASTSATTTPARSPTRCRRSTSTTDMFHGYDFDNTMLRIGSMNMQLHGVQNPDIAYRDSLAQEHAGDIEAYTPGPGQPPVRRVARLRGHRQGPPPGRQDQEDRTALPRPVPAPAQARRSGGGDRARRGAVRVVEGPQGTAADAGRGPETRRDRLAALRGVQALRRGLHRHLVLHQDQLRRHRPRLVLRPASRRLQSSTTNAPHCSTPPSSASPRPGADRRRARQEQPARHRSPAGTNATAPNATAPAPTSRSASPRPTSPPTTTT